MLADEDAQHDDADDVVPVSPSGGVVAVRAAVDMLHPSMHRHYVPAFAG